MASADALGLTTGDVSTLELSPKNGEGESSMGTLIQKALSSILAPLAERVLELEELGRDHENQLRELNEGAEKSRGRLDGHDQKVGLLTSDLARTNEDLRCTNDSLGEAHEKHAAMESDHDVTRATAGRTEANHKNTAASLADQNRLHEQLDAQVRQLQLALSETNIAHLNINDRVTEMRNRHEGLNDRHLDLVKSVQEVKQADENTRQAFKRITATFDKQRKDDQRSFSTLDDRTKNLEASVVEAQHQAELLGKIAKGNKAEVDRLRQLLAGINESHQGLQKSGNNNDMQGRLGKLEDSIAGVSKVALQEKNQTLGIVQAMSDQIHKNNANIAKNMSDLENLDKGVKAHENRLQKAEQNAVEQAASHQRLKEQAEKMETDLRGNIAGVQREAQSALDNQSHEINKTNSALQQAQLRADVQANGLQKANDNLSATQAHVAKLGSSLDLAHEYTQGLVKGMKDTHKRVASGQDGMLAPKQGPNRKLPALATPRSPSQMGSTV